MTDTTATVLFAGTLVAALVASHRPVGDWIHRSVTATGHSRAERLVYRAIGADPDGEQTWGAYARGVLAFSAVGVVGLYTLLRLQPHLPGSLGVPAMPADQAWNTAVSFVTNTNWQSYSGEASVGTLATAAGLAVQNFASAAVGICVALALVRGFARRSTDLVGSFWVDLVRVCGRVLLPGAAVAAVLLVAGGAVQTLGAGHDVTTLAGVTQHLPGGPVASQEAIKQLGTNGGGFFNANSAHPYENPTGWTSWLQVYLLLVVPFSLPRTFGRMVGRPRQGTTIALVMAGIAVTATALLAWAQTAHPGTVPQVVGGALEGTETRFGVGQSAVFAAATTLTSTGAVNSFHSSYTALGGGVAMLDMMLGEVAPGGVGSGLYGMLVLAVVTVFVAGLMVGRTPEYLGKKIGSREIRLVSLYLLTTPAIVLVGTAAAVALPAGRSSMLNGGAHGLSEVLYAYTSAGNNNGSAFAGLGANTLWYNTSLGLAMLLGRFVPILLVLALAGGLARQRAVPEGAGTLGTASPLFAGMLAGVTVVLVALTYLPALALGPLAEGLS